jgi:hypothetical protein
MEHSTLRVDIREAEAHAPVVRLQSRRAQAAGREEVKLRYRAGLDPPTPED